MACMGRASLGWLAVRWVPPGLRALTGVECSQQDVIRTRHAMATAATHSASASADTQQHARAGVPAPGAAPVSARDATRAMQHASFMTLRHPDSVLAVLAVDEPDCVITGCQDHLVRVWDGAAWTCLQTLPGHTRAVLALAHMHDWLFSGSSDTSIRVHDMRGGLPHTEMLRPHADTRIASEGTSSSEAGAATALSVVGGFVTVADIRLHAGAIYSLAVLRPEQRPGPVTVAHLFAGCQDTSVYRLDLTLRRGAYASPSAAVTHRVQFGGPQGFVYTLAFWQQPRIVSSERTHERDDETWVFAGSGDGCIRVWEGFTDSDAARVSDAGAAHATPSDAASTMASPPRRRPRVSSIDGEAAASSPAAAAAGVPVIDLHEPDDEPRDPVAVMEAPVVRDVTDLPSQMLAEPSDSAPQQAAPGGAAVLPGRCGGVYALACYGRDMYAGSQDGCIRVWDAETRHMKAVLRGHTAEILALCVADDPAPLPARAVLPTPVAVASLREDATTFISESLDSDRAVYGWFRAPALLCSGSADSTVRIWSTRTYTCLRTLHDGAGIILGLTARQHMLFSASNDHLVRVFDTNALTPTMEGVDTAQPAPGFLPGSEAAAVSDRRGTGWHRMEPLHVSEPGTAPMHASRGRSAMEFAFTPSAAAQAAAAHGDSARLRIRWPSAADLQRTVAPPGPGITSKPLLMTDYGVDLSPQGLLSCLRELISIPSVSLNETPSSATRDVNACWRAARYLHDLLLRVGAESRFVQGSPGANPMVLARLGGWNAGTPTVVIHAHYDVQPAGDLAQWETPPFTLTGRDGYLYARGATDNKGPLLALIFAAARCIEARKQRRRRRVSHSFADLSSATAASETASDVGDVAFVFAIEGEGENGSIGFRDAILQNLEWFAHASLILNCNNTWIGDNVPCLTYGMRGLVKLRVDVEGPSTDLHSGLDGGVTHEPLMDLCGILTSLVDPVHGRIAVQGIYDQVAPLSEEELALYRGLDFDVQGYMTARGIHGVYSGCNAEFADANDPEPAPARGHPRPPISPPETSLGRPRKQPRLAQLTSDADSVASLSPTMLEQRRRADADAGALHAESHVSAHEPAGVSSLPPGSLWAPDPQDDLAMGAPVTAPSASLAVAAASRVAPTTTDAPRSSGGEQSHAHAGESKVAARDVPAAAAVLLRRWREPSLSVHGITCSAANDSIIPRKASAFVSIRTVPHMTSTHTFELVAAHLQRAFARRHSVNRVRVSMTSHAAWWLQSPTHPHYQAAARAVARHWGRDPIFVREGGTVRVTTFLERTLSAGCVHLPMGEATDAPHLPNERIAVRNLSLGVRVCETLFTDIAAAALAPQGKGKE